MLNIIVHYIFQVYSHLLLAVFGIPPQNQHHYVHRPLGHQESQVLFLSPLLPEFSWQCDLFFRWCILPVAYVSWGISYVVKLPIVHICLRLKQHREGLFLLDIHPSQPRGVSQYMARHNQPWHRDDDPRIMANETFLQHRLLNLSRKTFFHSAA